MRTFIKLSSLATIAGLMLAVGCGSDDDSGSSDDDSSDDGSSGGTTGDGGTTGGGGTTSDGGTTTSSGGTTGDGGTTTSSGGTTSDGGTTSTGSGGSAGGGNGGAPPDEPPYSNSDCIAEDGPTAAVTGSETGAFSEEADWHEGWTNFSTDSSGVDCSGTLSEIAVEADGTLSDDTTLTAADSPYALNEKIWVADGQTLTIEPGVALCAGPDGAVIVSRGGMIDADGTADEPIVFTSSAEEGDKQQGDWGGLIVLGKASGFKGTDVLVEGLDNEDRNMYGGSENDDNSGTIAYVRIEFGGTEISPGNEINGLTLGGVGSGTTIHHVQVNTTLDDCFEWFGGTVNVSHLVCNNVGDDMFDADQGYRGTLDTLLGIGVQPLSSDPNGFEFDGDLAGTEPATDVTASNVTLCGTGEEQNALTYGMVLRELVEGTFSSVVISGFDAAVDTRDPVVTDDEPNIMITDSTVFESLVYSIAYDETDTDSSDSPTYDDDEGFDERAWFTDGDGNVAYE